MNPNKLLVANNKIKKLSKDLHIKRQNKSPAELFSNVLINLINTKQKKPAKLC